MSSGTNPKIKPYLSVNNTGTSPSPARGKALFPVGACLQANNPSPACGEAFSSPSPARGGGPGWGPNNP